MVNYIERWETQMTTVDPTETRYVVQAWVKGYEYWTNTAVLPENMFSLPIVGYATETEGRERYLELTTANPSGKYRLIREISITEVIVTT